MSPLTPSELLQIHELTRSQDAGIEKLTAYLGTARDPELQSMLRHARQKCVTQYQELLSVAEGTPLPRNVDGLDGGLAGRSHRDSTASVSPVRPEFAAGLSDRTIACDLLDGAKSMAVRAIWAATEVSHIGLRRALSDIARYYLDAAYEFYRYMEQQGWYSPLQAGDNAERWFRDTHKPVATDRQPAYS
jgi:hypothetical protein